ncbi:MAG: DUF4442 domain-containing protein [Bacteroidota bacterium]
MGKFSVKNLNKFLFFKLPSAYLSGIRVTSINEKEAMASVKYKWINQNPFKSMYWATQGMASELVTGILLMKKIAQSNKKISMLVISQNGEFYKKATGKITFICKEGEIINEVIKTAISTGEGQILKLTAEGFNEEFEPVSKFEYTWSIKLKS